MKLVLSHGRRPSERWNLYVFSIKQSDWNRVFQQAIVYFSYTLGVVTIEHGTVDPQFIALVKVRDLNCYLRQIISATPKVVQGKK